MAPGSKGKRSILLFLVLVLGAMVLTLGFFFYTSRTSTSTNQKLYLPKNADRLLSDTKIKPEGSLTILLLNNDLLYYYEGALHADGSNLKKTNYDDIRKIIVDKKSRTAEKDFVVVIKPAEEATYRHTVNILDEMTINDVKHYGMLEISKDELEVIRKLP